MNALVTQFEFEPLPFAPRLYADETLWSWMTRTALYWGFSAEEFLIGLGSSSEVAASPSVTPDFDCAPSRVLTERLSYVTGVPQEVIRSHIIARHSALLWPEGRAAFCELCFDELAVNGSPYVRRAWLDAWCIQCPRHRVPLCTVQQTDPAHRPIDWNRIWTAKRAWASATLARYPDPHPAVIQHSEVQLWYPPLQCLRPDGLDRYPRNAAARPAARSPESRGRPENPFERQLVILAGQVFSDFSMARAFFSIRDRLTWRNTGRGLDPAEPLGTLALRSGAIRIGAALADVLLRRPARNAALTVAIRDLVRGLNRATQRLINAELALWPSVWCDRWVAVFGWPDRPRVIRSTPT